MSDIKSFISNIVIVMPDIWNYINQKLTLANYNINKNTTFTGPWKKAGLNSCPRKLVVEIVSTDIVGTLKCFYSKCSQHPCRKNIPTSLVVEGSPQAKSN